MSQSAHCFCLPMLKNNKKEIFFIFALIVCIVFLQGNIKKKTYTYFDLLVFSSKKLY